MDPPILDRDCLPTIVFFSEQMPRMRSTYHRPCGVPGAAGRRRRTAAFALASSLVAMLAGARAVPGASARPAAHAAAAQTLVIEGTGNGHGVGMSQDGALGYARHGLAYQQILAHYYTGTTLGTVSPKTVVKVLVGSKVKRIAIERYVRGVVAAEMPSSWPAAALQAQAVASRTYALTAHAGGSRFDVYADTRSQVFRGAAAETPATNAAVAATAGQIVLYGGRPAITYFFASSGGMTESVQYGFPGAAPAPWLVGVTDAYEGSSARWRLEVSVPDRRQAPARPLPGPLPRRRSPQARRLAADPHRARARHRRRLGRSAARRWPPASASTAPGSTSTCAAARRSSQSPTTAAARASSGRSPPARRRRRLRRATPAACPRRGSSASRRAAAAPPPAAASRAAALRAGKADGAGAQLRHASAGLGTPPPARPAAAPVP